MRTVSWKSVIDGLFARPGMAVPSEAAALNAALEFIGCRLHDAWEHFPWSELGLTEYRLFRAEWVAGNFAAGAEVYHNGSYWRALEAVTAADVPGEFGAAAQILVGVGLSFAYSADGDYIVYTSVGSVVSKWAELVRFRKTVDYRQAGKTELGAVLGAWTDDPRKNKAALRVPYRLTGEGPELSADYVPVGVWLEFRQVAPQVAPTVYSALAVYEAGDAVYIEPKAWDVLATTVAGETPTSTAAKFREKPMPSWLVPAIKAGAYGDLKGADGQDEKAVYWDNKFTKLLDEQVDQITLIQGQVGRVHYRS